MPVNSGAVDVLADFYAENPAFATSAGQVSRAYPWFGWPGQSGPRISRTVLDTMSALANGQIDAGQASATMASEIEGLLAR